MTRTLLRVALGCLGAILPTLELQAQTPDDNQPEAAAESATTALPTHPASPALVMRRFFEHMNRYTDTKDAEELHRAGRLFDLDDVLKGDQEYVGDQAARDLLNFMDRALLPFREGLVKSPAPDETEFSHLVAFQNRDGQVTTADLRFSRDQTGGWRLSQETRKSAADLYDRVRHLTPRHGRGGVSDATTWLRDHMPRVLFGRWLLLDHWQWLGLLGLVLLGVATSLVARLLTMHLRRRILKRRGIEAETSGWHRSRPFGLMAAATAWYFGLPYLVLPEFSFFALMFTARLLLMVGATWATCSLIDYGAEFFGALAAETATKVDDVVVPMLQRVLKIFVVVMGVIWIADNLDVNVKALLAGLGIGGLAFALAAKDTVENFFGAVSILTDRPFEVGDWIVIDDIEGTVETVGFRSTRIRTFYNSLITVPNALLTRATVDNLGARQFRRLKTELDVTYDTSPDKIEAFCEGIRELIRRHPYTRKDYYHVYFNGYAESSLRILLYLFLKTPDWATELREKHRFFLDILRLAEQLGVQFAFPTRTLFMTETTPTERPAASPSVDASRREGRGLAREIVRRFTGATVPPPVRMVSDARDDSAGEGE